MEEKKNWARGTGEGMEPDDLQCSPNARSMKDGEGTAKCPSCSQSAHGEIVLVRCAQLRVDQATLDAALTRPHNRILPSLGNRTLVSCYALRYCFISFLVAFRAEISRTVGLGLAKFRKGIRIVKDCGRTFEGEPMLAEILSGLRAIPLEVIPKRFDHNGIISYPVLKAKKRIHDGPGQSP